MQPQLHVAVDWGLKLHGVWDTINSALATAGSPTRLPGKFYNCKARSIIYRTVTKEGYTGIKYSVENRTVGTGALLGNAVQCMGFSTWQKEP